MICKHCSSEKIVKKGKRQLIDNVNQIYLCRNCGKKFSLKKGKFSDNAIVFAVNSFNSGKSLSEVAKEIRKRFHVSVSEMNISRWAEKYGNSFLRLRNELKKKYKDNDIVKSKRFVHSGLIYGFLLHNWKLNEFCRFDGLKNYLTELDSWIDKYFKSENRCSQLKSVKDFNVAVKKNFICSAVGNILGACKSNKERHSTIQNYLLYNDSATIACEVPVWMWDKKIGAICGHIDVLQIRFGKIWVMDYKPGAADVNKLQVGSQLYWYARALSFRSRIPLDKFRCAWFDEQACYEFDPNKMRLGQ